MNDKPTIEKSITTSATPSHRSWIEDGILYSEFQGEISLPSIMETEEDSLRLLKEHNIKIIPLITIFKNMNQMGFKLSFADYGKASGITMVKYTSAIWVVGATGMVKRSLSLVNRIFFGNRIHIVDTLEEAQKGAHAVLLNEEPILEKV